MPQISDEAWDAFRDAWYASIELKDRAGSGRLSEAYSVDTKDHPVKRCRIKDRIRDRERAAENRRKLQSAYAGGCVPQQLGDEILLNLYGLGHSAKAISEMKDKPLLIAKLNYVEIWKRITACRVDGMRMYEIRDRSKR